MRREITVEDSKFCFTLPVRVGKGPLLLQLIVVHETPSRPFGFEIIIGLSLRKDQRGIGQRGLYQEPGLTYLEIGGLIPTARPRRMESIGSDLIQLPSECSTKPPDRLGFRVL